MNTEKQVRLAARLYELRDSNGNTVGRVEVTP